MSTRACVILKDEHTKLYFYRHSDGEPETVIPSLDIFMDWLIKGLIRGNAEQAGGWLILLGMQEYLSAEQKDIKLSEFSPANNGEDSHYTWKIGAYEPANGIQCHVEFVYTIDLNELTVSYDTIKYYD